MIPEDMGYVQYCIGRLNTIESHLQEKQAFAEEKAAGISPLYTTVYAAVESSSWLGRQLQLETPDAHILSDVDIHLYTTTGPVFFILPAAI